MYRIKEGLIASIVVLLVVLGGFFLYDGDNSLTGAVTGLASTSSEENLLTLTENSSNNEEKDVSITAFCSGETTCSCGDDVDGDLNLTGDVGTCGFSHGLVIAADNIVVDCKGNQILGGSEVNFYGIRVSRNHNVTIKNCIVSGFDSGIYYSESENGSIENVTVNGMLGDGVEFTSDSLNNSLIGSNITSNVGAGVRIALSSHRNSVRNNLFNNNSDEIYVSGSSNSTLTNNTLTSGQADGIRILSSSNNTLVTNNTINDTTQAIDLSQANFTTIQGNIIYNTSDDGISVLSSYSLTIDNNTITDPSGQGMDLTSATANVTNNFINSSTAVSIYGNPDDSVISNNTLLNSGTNGIQILFGGLNNTIQYNEVNNSAAAGIVYGDASGNINFNTVYNASSGILFSGVPQSNIVRNNTLLSVDSGIHAAGSTKDSIYEDNLIQNAEIGIQLGNGAENNTFLNNNISSPTNYTIYDPSGSDDLNYLIYNNSFGEIKWINDSAGFLENLTLNVSSLALGDNLFIGDNVIALNTSAFEIGLINSSANVTVNGLGFSEITKIYKLNSYSTDPSAISSGTNCLGDSSCANLSYNGSTLIFNTTSFSSFTASANLTCGDTITEDTNLTANLNASGTCFTIGAHNITVDGKGFNITGSDTGVGISNTGGYDNVTVRNFGIISEFSSGLKLDGDVVNFTFTNNTILNSSEHGVDIDSAVQSTFSNNTVSNSAWSGMGIDDVESLTVVDNIFTASTFHSVHLGANVTYSLFENNSFPASSSGNGMKFQTSSNNNVTANTFSAGESSTLLVIDASSSNNIFKNNSFLVNDVAISISDTAGSSNYLIYENVYGQVSWYLENLTTLVKDLDFSGNLSIGNNSVFVNGSFYPSLNNTANITLYGIGDRGFVEAGILRDGVECDSTTTPSCYNFTALDASTVGFNVSGFSNYSIGEVAVVCGQVLTTDTTLTGSLTTNGTCLTVGAPNIIINGAGFNITGNTSGYGINNSDGYDNVTIANFSNVVNFSVGIYGSGMANSTVENMNVSFNADEGIYLTSSSDGNSLSNLTTYNNTQTGVYIISSSNNSLADITVYNNTGNAVQISNGGNHTLLRLNITDIGNYALRLQTTTQNRIEDSFFYDDGVNLFSSTNNSFIQNAIDNHQFSLSSGSANNTFQNNNITTFFIPIDDKSNLSNSNFLIYNNSNGRIVQELVNLSTTNEIGLGINLNISENYVYLNSSAHPNFNTTANITLYSVGDRGFYTPIVLGDGAVCDSTTTPSCYNFTALNASTVQFNVSSFSNYTIAEGPVACGDTITQDTTLTENLSISGAHCLTINTSDVVLDCAGFSVIGNKAGGTTGIAITTTANNVTLRGCTVEAFELGVTLSGGSHTVINNTVHNTSAYGIWLSSSDNNTVSNNTVYNTLFNGIWMFGSNQNNVTNNLFYDVGSSGSTILDVQNSNDNQLLHNVVYNSTAGLGASGSSQRNVFMNNTVYNTSSGIVIGSTAQNNVFLNNNLTLNTVSINDTNSYNNTLEFNNSFGNISILAENLSIVDSIGLEDGVLINNNSAAINASAYPNLNTSATITLRQLNWSEINVIWKVSNFTNNSAYIIANGSDCILGGSCTLSSYDNSSGELVFTTDSFSSFAADYDAGIECGLVGAGITLSSNVTTTGDCFTLDQDNSVLDCAGYSIIGDGGVGDIGVTSDSRNNVTIRDCVIENFYQGIYLDGATNSTVTNSTIQNSSHTGIKIENSEEGIHINSSSSLNSSLYGIQVLASNFTNISFSNLVGSGSYGFLISKATGGVYYNNTINDSGSVGFLITLNTLNSQFTNNVVEDNVNYGFLLSNSGLPLVQNNSFVGNEIYSHSRGFVLSGLSLDNWVENNTLYSNSLYDISLGYEAENNTLINNNVTALGLGVEDSSNTTTLNSLVYNSSFGKINWTLANLTTNISLHSNSTIFVENNTLGLIDDTNTFHLNGSAELTYYGLGYASTPHLVKNSQICFTPSCNATAYSGGVLSADVLGFSNYSTQANNNPQATTINFTSSIYTNTTIAYLNVTVEDQDNETMEVNYSWYVNDVSVKNQSFSNVVNGSTVVANLSVTEYNYNKSDVINVTILVTDTLLANSTNITTATVQNVEPSITTPLTSQTVEVNSTFYYDYNASDADVDDGIDSLNWTDNSSLFVINNSTGIINVTFNESDAGTYLINISVNDTTSPSAVSSDEFTLIVNDTLAPRILNISSPQATTYAIGTENISLNYTVVDANLDSCSYSLNGAANVTLSGCANSTINTSSGSYTLILYANDSYGNTNSSTVSFTVNASTPSGGGGSSSGGGSSTFTCTVDTDCASKEGELYCFNGQVYKDVTAGLCNNPAKSTSSCSYMNESTPTLVAACSYGCLSGECLPPSEGSSTMEQIIIGSGSSCQPGYTLVDGFCVNQTLEQARELYYDLEEKVTQSFPTAYIKVLPDQETVGCLQKVLNPVLAVGEDSYQQALTLLENGETGMTYSLSGNILQLLWVVHTQEEVVTELYFVEKGIQFLPALFGGDSNRVVELITFSVSDTPTLVAQEFVLCEEVAGTEFRYHLR